MAEVSLMERIGMVLGNKVGVVIRVAVDDEGTRDCSLDIMPDAVK